MAGNPSIPDQMVAMTRALAARRARYVHLSLTAAAIAEQVEVIPGRAQPASDGWWHIGLIHDAIADCELDVWYCPPRRLAVSVRERQAIPKSIVPTLRPGERGWAVGWDSVPRRTTTDAKHTPGPEGGKPGQA